MPSRIVLFVFVFLMMLDPGYWRATVPYRKPPEVERVAGVWEEGGVMEGYFSYYGRRPSEATRQYQIDRGVLPANLPEEAILMAHANCGMVGQRVQIKVGDDPSWHTAWVADCAGSVETLRWMSDNRILGELFYDAAVRFDFYGRGAEPGRMRYN